MHLKSTVLVTPVAMLSLVWSTVFSLLYTYPGACHLTVPAHQ